MVVIGLSIWAFMAWSSAPLPEAEAGPKAEQLADKMLSAVQKDAWDSLGYIRWSFMGQADYVWDVQNHKVRVAWDDVKVLLDPNQVSGAAWEGGERLAESEAYVK